jgi:hypothetical protein
MLNSHFLSQRLGRLRMYRPLHPQSPRPFSFLLSVQSLDILAMAASVIMSWVSRGIPNQIKQNLVSRSYLALCPSCLSYSILDQILTGLWGSRFAFLVLSLLVSFALGLWSLLQVVAMSTCSTRSSREVSRR